MSNFQPNRSLNNRNMRISDFKNIHEGKNLFILASGPSLSALSLDRLKNRIVMGLNRSALIYADTHYHCTMDERIFTEHPEMLQKTRYLFTLPNRAFGVALPLLGSEGFSFDLEQGIYSGYTVSYFALQIAVYMGFRQVFYLGLDLKNRGYLTHFFGHDFNSIHHDKTEYPKMRKMLEYAAEILKNKNVQVFNCNEESALDCFPKVSYDWAISQ